MYISMQGSVTKTCGKHFLGKVAKLCHGSCQGRDLPEEHNKL